LLQFEIVSLSNKLRKKLFIVVNELNFFLSHRLPVAEAALAEGYAVTVGYGDLGGADCSMLTALGIRSHLIPMSRCGRNPFEEIRTFYALWRVLVKLKPDLVHFVTIKPYLYGGIAARLTRAPGVVSAVAGLGNVFIQKNWKGRFFRALLFPLYLPAFGHPNQCVIVHNDDDSKFLVAWGVLDPQKVRLLRGSGVCLAKFSQFDEPEGVPTICFAARLLREKGVHDFVSAAKLLHKRGTHAKFWLAGDVDSKNATGLTEQDLRDIREEGTVELLGYQRDIPGLYARSHIVCLPSFYGEGIPKSLIEAAAASRAIVTTDHPGCRDAIIPNVSGLLVPIKNPEKLADALQWLIEHPQERVAMGKAGRELAEREFTIERIVREHLDIYRELLNGG